MTKESLLEIPYGTRDFLPGEARDMRRIESALMGTFDSWGYDEIETPSTEFLDILTMGSGRLTGDRMFKFFDRTNRTVALRHEMTTPIARLVSSRMKDVPLPIKLAYSGSVFRYEEAQSGRQCEFHQAGVEFMGDSSAAADAEVIALSIEAMRRAGLKDFRVCLGQVGFVREIMDVLNLSDAKKASLRLAMERRDLVGLRIELSGTDLTRPEMDTLAGLPMLHGGPVILDEAMKSASGKSARGAIENLSAIYDLLKIYGVDEFIQFDLGIIRDFEYYTGMVFEAYTPGLGFPLCGGGRYDRLLSEFGRDCPATGFSIGIERAMLALEKDGALRTAPHKDVYVAYAPGSLLEAIRLAGRRREAGEKVLLSPRPQSLEEATASQAEKRCLELVYVR